PLRFPSGAARIEKIERMLAVEGGWGAVCIDVLQFPIPPCIAAFFHVDFVSCAAKNDHAFDGRVTAQRVLNIFLEWHNCAAAMCAVRRDEGSRAAIGNAVAN